jgi:hypothetical protein
MSNFDIYLTMILEDVALEFYLAGKGFSADTARISSSYKFSNLNLPNCMRFAHVVFELIVGTENLEACWTTELFGG